MSKINILRHSHIIPDDAQQEYWAVVEHCIREFHPKRSASALKKLAELQKMLMNRSLEEFELFFHAEPFDVACDLASHRLNVEDHMKRYLEIRDEENVQIP
jgi:hypothetical protein